MNYNENRAQISFGIAYSGGNQCDGGHDLEKIQLLRCGRFPLPVIHDCSAAYRARDRVLMRQRGLEISCRLSLSLNHAGEAIKPGKPIKFFRVADFGLLQRASQD